MQIEAMGKLRIKGADGLKQQQPLVLLCYLALAGPKTRDHLAMVFWPQAKRPLNNLSSALSRIRNHVPEAIVVEQNVVACTLDSDVAALQQAIRSLDTEGIEREYRRPFFESSTLRMGIELEEWVWATRESLAVAASAALVTAAEKAPVSARSRLAKRAHEIGRDFWVERELWQRCYNLAGDDVGLAERVRVDAAHLDFELHVEQAQPGLSMNSHGLFGRSAEIDVLDGFHASSPTAWMAIVGMGGVGKTALASAWLAEIDRHSRCTTHWVELADVRSAQQLPEVTATALGMPYKRDRALFESLERICSVDEPMAIVLDNLEQIRGYESFLGGLAAIDGITVIATTRVASDDPCEQVLPLEGLVGSRAAEAQALFIARALPVCPDIAGHPHLIQQACELLGGHPLAIELVTAWLRLIPLDIAVESLVDSQELMTTSPEPSLESIESLLDRSWKLLDADQARALGKLALFDASFSYNDAMATTESSLTTLAALVASSLLRRRDGDLSLHPLVRHYALAKLQSTDPLAADVAERRFVEYFRGETAEAAAAMRGPQAGTASATLAASFVNVQVAWRLALQRRQWQTVGEMADGITAYLKSQSRLFLASDLLGRALDTLHEAVSVGQPDVAAARALVAVGWRYAMTRLVQGDRTDAIETVERCTLHCHPTDRSGLMCLAYMRGQIANFSGKYQDAADHFAHARSLADDQIEEWFVAETETASAMVALCLEQIEEARGLTRSVLETGRRLGNPVIISDAYYCLGTLDSDEDPAGALILLDEASAVAEAASLTQKSRKYATIIGRCHIALDDPDTATTVFERALVESVDGSTVHEPWVRIANMSGLAMARGLTGQHEQAAELFAEAVRATVELDDWPIMLEAVVDICRLRFDRSGSWAWWQLARTVAFHEATQLSWQLKAQDMLAEAGYPTECQSRPMVETAIEVVGEWALQVLQS